MHLISWNVNGIRAIVKKEFLNQINILDPDILCLQETKAQDDQVSEALKGLPNYYIYSHSATKKGYSGVAIITKQKPIEVSQGIGIEIHDDEGRVIVAEYNDFIIVNVYVPNSGDGLKRLDYRSEWDKAFGDFVGNLKRKKPVIITGDFNVAHQSIDLARPKENYNKTAGYTQVEIEGLDFILSKGFVDSFRCKYPDKIQYSFWSTRFGAREKNLGWRIDYFLVDNNISEKIVDATIYDTFMGSDHCPIGLIV